MYKRQLQGQEHILFRQWKKYFCWQTDENSGRKWKKQRLLFQEHFYKKYLRKNQRRKQYKAFYREQRQNFFFQVWKLLL